MDAVATAVVVAHTGGTGFEQAKAAAARRKAERLERRKQASAAGGVGSQQGKTQAPTAAASAASGGGQQRYVTPQRALDPSFGTTAGGYGQELELMARRETVREAERRQEELSAKMEALLGEAGL